VFVLVNLIIGWALYRRRNCISVPGDRWQDSLHDCAFLSVLLLDSHLCVLIRGTNSGNLSIDVWNLLKKVDVFICANHCV